MYLGLVDQDNRIVGEIFLSDIDGRVTITLGQPGVPVEVVEWMIAKAKVRLPTTDPVSASDGSGGVL
ncbi:hypothetical protein [Mesorhizobium sp.]|uniref:hypothetical protein n=1 Tax=Mesorhizobium sp. TaxID=1871066 RepID=UPI00122243EC|nr:hypothetical protein [Mesorhizobium sp.]TIT03393.1 MAG: hypothetical protein E5W87_05760 [Mesorhizobium sp.]